MSSIGASKKLLSLTGLSLALSQRFTRIDSEAEVFNSIEDILANICPDFEIEAAAVVMRKPNQMNFRKFLQDMYSFGINESERSGLSFFLAQSIVPEIDKYFRCIIREDVRKNIRSGLPAGLRTKMVSMLAAPMIYNGQVIGILMLFRSEIAAFCPDDETFFGKVALMLAEETESACEYLRLARDSITGFYNRRIFFESVNIETARARRYQAPLSVLMLEVQALTSWNDEKNKNADQFLKRFSQRIASEVRQSDLVARATESLFLFLLPMTDSRSSVDFANRLYAHLNSHPLLINESPIPFKLSIGISHLCSSDDDPSAMLNRAEAALDKARKTGSNKISVLSANE